MTTTPLYEEVPVIPHFGSDLLVWLWWRAECSGNLHLRVGEEDREVLVWVDNRLRLLSANEDWKATLAGEQAPTTPEAYHALAKGKRVVEIRVCLQTGDRQYDVTLLADPDGPLRAKLPALVRGGGLNEQALERMYLAGELWEILLGIVRVYIDERLSPEWPSYLSAMRLWVREGMADARVASDDE